MKGLTLLIVTDLKKGMNAILENTADATRMRIRGPILVKDGHRLKGETWQAFWLLSNPDDDHTYADTKRGFAPYGKQGKDGFKIITHLL